MSDRKMVTLKGNQGELKINGQIDRVDLDNLGNALIFDYKTGVQSSKVRTTDIVNGIRFQLPLYMLALEELNNSYKAVYGGYYLVKDSENCERKDVLADKSIVNFVGGRTQAGLPNNKIVDEEGNQLSLDNLLRHSVNQAIKKVDELKNGHFQHTKFPETAGCESYCEFRRICQKNVGKLKSMREKDKD
jgi:ATP-dependent helicase/DNAse subunit B